MPGSGGSHAGAFLGRQLAPERLSDGGGVIERANTFESLALGRLGVCRRAQCEGKTKRVERGMIPGVAQPGAEPTTPVEAQGCLRNPDEGRELATHGRPLGRALAVVEDPLKHVGGHGLAGCSWVASVAAICSVLHRRAAYTDVDLEPWSGTGSSGTVAEGSAAGLSLGSSDMIGRGASRWCPFSRPPGRP